MRGLSLFAVCWVIVGCVGDPERDEVYWRRGQAFVPFVDESSTASGERAKAAGDVALSSVGSSESADDGNFPSKVEEDYELVSPEYHMRNMSREELAMALRPITGDAKGRAYIAAEPNFELADAILRTSPDESFFVEGRDALNQPVRETQWLFGADSRTSTTNVNPFRQTVHFSNNCSGVWIGHHTIITAAHCLYDTATNTFKTPIVLTTYKQGPANNGIGTPINLSDPSVGNGVAVPAAFDAGTTNNWEWDYAVIDLTGYATSPVGWNGYWVNYSGQAQKGYGYPKSGTSQATVALCPGRATDGYLCGMSGNGEVNGYRFESWDIDITAGQSGGPWLASTNHTIGTVIGEVSYPDLFKCGLSLCFRNVARRIDNAYWNWIVAWSADH